jgi:hypothetical protein
LLEEIGFVYLHVSRRASDVIFDRIETHEHHFG